MTTLSPAAQAVMHAFRNTNTMLDGPNCAAALRAAASRVEDLIPDLGSAQYARGVEAAADFIENIADELENHQ